MSFPVVDGYRLIDGPPTTADYLELRVRSGLSTKTHDQIRSRAPSGAFVSLLADPPGRPLYARHGFAETAPGSVGMGLTLA